MFRDLEPFPLFVDASPPSEALHFAVIASSHMLSAAFSLRPHKSRVSIYTKVTNHLWTRYYQYQVTFGLYMLTRNEAIVINGMVLAFLAAMSYAFWIGFESFVLRLICRILYYITGSLSGADELCNQ